MPENPPPAALPEISLVVPMFDEADGLDVFFTRVVPVLRGLGAEFEIVCINDGSRDGTLAALLARRADVPELVILDLSRNFGKEAALSAGLDHARGQAVIPFDADLQDPPEVIPALVAQWREGYEVVLAQRVERLNDTWFKRTSAGCFYRVHNWLAEMPISANVGDFRLIDRRVLDALTTLPERRRFMKGLFAWVGFSTAVVPYSRGPREQGRSKLGFWRLWNLALEGITSFSSLPLRLWFYVGLTISALSFLYASFIVIRTLILGVDVPGYASLLTVILFLGGLQLLSLGLLGEYIGRIYAEVKGRPVYLVRRLYGRDQPSP